LEGERYVLSFLVMFRQEFSGTGNLEKVVNGAGVTLWQVAAHFPASAKSNSGTDINFHNFLM
jgi:hypothetical protein